MVRRVTLGKLQALALGGLLIGTTPVAATEYPSLDPVRGVVTMAPLLERTTPAVVNVSVESRQAADTNPLFADPFFRRFFDAPPQTRERRTVSAGSGVIVDARRGLILTNHHVVADADRITVNLKDGRDFAAELVGSDPATDVALLRIAGQNLTELAFGDSSRLEVGDLVIAIGNPFGLGQTVTSGIVSALGRSGIVRGNYEDFIQTDAAINPGNSGGALINSKGELIGINSAILSQGGGNVGIGFAVPANMARSVMDQLLRFGAVRRGQIGVALQDVPPKQAAAQGLGVQGGALIARVEPGSPAARAGLRQGDIVVAVEGSPVRSSTELRNRIALVETGSSVTLDILREGRRSRLKVAPAMEQRADPSIALPALVGATLDEIPPGHPAYGRIGGVLVTRVTRDSAAARAGLRRGDLIIGIDGEPIGSLAELGAALSPERDRLTVNLLRGDTQLALVIG